MPNKTGFNQTSFLDFYYTHGGLFLLRNSRKGKQLNNHLHVCIFVRYQIKSRTKEFYLKNLKGCA